jgi:serine/threonine protein kinase
MSAAPPRPQKKRRLGTGLVEANKVAMPINKEAPITISSSPVAHNQAHQINVVAAGRKVASNFQLATPGSSRSGSNSIMVPDGSLFSALDAAGIPHRPHDRHVDGYKVQIRRWYDHVERQIESKSFYAVKEKLGEGGQGRAILVENTAEPGVPLVAKFFAKESDAREEIDMLKIEIGRHGNIVTMVQEWGPSSFIPGVSVLFLEYCDRGTLVDYREALSKKQQPVAEGMIWHVSISLGRALAFLHSGYPNTRTRNYAIAHRDIKPENVLLKTNPTQPFNLVVKLGDFGMARRLTRASGLWTDLYSNGGTHDWQAPEHVCPPHLAGPEQDMWALGAIIHYLALGEPPIDLMKANHALEYRSQAWKSSIPRYVNSISYRPDRRRKLGNQKNYKGDGHKDWSVKYSIKLNQWMMKMLKVIPHDRVTAIEVAEKMSAGSEL